MKLVRGYRDARGMLQVYVDDVGACDSLTPKDRKPIDPRFDLFNHSPTGFECGYHGSGPAQLALAILSAALEGVENGDKIAVRLHQDFKREVVARLPRGENWHLSLDEIRDKWIPERAVEIERDFDDAVIES